jgi:hypothetical protein
MNLILHLLAIWFLLNALAVVVLTPAHKPQWSAA